ncbi:hypothetical protein AM493_01065 [Flavobacterium akiainvivens]|uniref:Uncharacterized protein n=1 Tax=Flavobacterium akiainvivens TaxID=1202724 RepID=A0A0M9VGS1_9FLAO|nr:hypothetical protein [Flavobacterium akiainvivens]KOS04789.1 hypothetical protein AM493_01065 [Flavobacterium akiainvivens]
MKSKIKKFFGLLVPDGIEDFIREILVPKIKASLTLRAGLQFPREYLQPVYGPNGENPFGNPDPSQALNVIPATDAEGNPKVTLLFAEANFYADTEQGLGYAVEFVIETNTYAQIGNTGIIIYLDNLKLDLSKTTNIPEADADGRPSDFIGIYAEELDVILPKKWFSNIQENTTLQIAAKKLLVGTGGFSGTIALETIVGGNPPGEDDILWFNIGGENGFRAGFTSFDINFHQSKVTSSSVKGALEIKKFVYPDNHSQANQQVVIGIEGVIEDDGGFRLTGSVQDYPITFPGVFNYTLKTVELGRDDDDSPFYIGTSGTLEFLGILGSILHIGPIEIQSLKIYSDGSMEFSGGSINLVEPIPLPLGPVDITVTAIHYGSHQKEVNGQMRKFSYFGFDGGLKVDPFGVEIRGDGVKYYFCTDDLPNRPSSYLHIQTLYLDLTIPMNEPVAIINGRLTIPEPGVSKEYIGSVSFQLPDANIAGSANMKLAPSHPAFLVETAVDFPAPIPMGAVTLYGFNGLLGYRYVADKQAIGLTADSTWYDYYKKPPRGINYEKFAGPDQTSGYTDPFSIGAGVSMGTTFDNGTVLNIKAMLLLSIPTLFMLDGRAAVLAARLKLDSPQDPPFFAFAAVGQNSMELGFGADYKLPKDNGQIFNMYASVQAAFFFNDSSKWYVNFGTKTTPSTAEILKLINIKSYLMLSAKGIEAGARGDFDFKRKYGPVKVHAWAYIEVGGKISFERPQFGAYLDAGVGADINVRVFEIHASLQILFAVEAAKPYLIYGKARIKIRIRVLFFKFSFDKQVEILWEKSKQVDRTPVNPLISAANQDRIPQLVKGVNMLTSETFDLAYLSGGIPGNLPAAVLEKVIPLDTYIDIKTEKGLLPEAIGNLIGGVNGAPNNYTDLIPPDKIVKGKELRQVKHQYAITALSIKSWRPASQGVSAGWIDYHPYAALYPNDSQISSYKVGQFQKNGNQYNTVRLLATTPFSYTEQGQPGWFIPEQYGLTPGSIFCEAEALLPVCANFLNKPLGQQYYHIDNNSLFYANTASFLLLNADEGETAEVTDYTNVFNFAQSLAFKNRTPLQIMLAEPSVYASLRLTSDSQGVRIKYYAPLINDSALEVQYGHPDPSAVNQSLPFTVTVSVQELGLPVVYNHPGWRAITKIVIEPLYPNPLLVGSLNAQIAQINNQNDLIAVGLATGQPQSPQQQQSELNTVNSQQGQIATVSYLYNSATNQYAVNNGQSLNWTTSWDLVNKQKIPTNPIGFNLTGNTLQVQSNFQVLGVRFLPERASIGYLTDNIGRNVTIKFDRIQDYLNNQGHVEVEVGLFDDSGLCNPDNTLCTFSTKQVYAFQRYVNPDMIQEGQLPDMIENVEYLLEDFLSFAQSFPQYNLVNEMSEEIQSLEAFIDDPDFLNYVAAYAATMAIVNHIIKKGGCNCKGDDLEILYDEIAEILDNHFPDAGQLGNVNSQVTYAQQVITLLNDFNTANPGYNILTNLSGEIAIVNNFINNPNTGTYAGAAEAIAEILTFINNLGGNAFDRIPNTTLLHSVCWMSLEAYEYNENIPGMAAVEADAQAAINGITQYIQPIWRPDTSYLVNFTLKDSVDNGAGEGVFNFTYGFTTQGPVGYNAFNNEALTTLSHYIDYQRSYPNADGNLLSAKPLFYDTDNAELFLFWTKPYATHFFHNWQLYNGKPALNGRIKVVIKDPAEADDIVNPPYLDYDEDDITTTHIPQTVEAWEDDLNPLMPFVLQQWINLYNSNDCIIVGAEPIRPASKYISIALKNLKPNKLYTAMVNNLFDRNSAGGFDPVLETKEVHKYVFKTSRYANFYEQVHSFLLFDGAGEDAVTREAIFNTDVPLDSNAASNALYTITGIANTADQLITKYQHAYDRIFEGIFKMNPLDEAISTELNIIRNSNSGGSKVALIIRNPEPFNIPKIPIDQIADTIVVISNGVPDANYKVLHSKDYSQAIIMHTSQVIPSGLLTLRFTYKLWNGFAYQVNNTQTITINLP